FSVPSSILEKRCMRKTVILCLALCLFGCGRASDSPNATPVAEDQDGDAKSPGNKRAPKAGQKKSVDELTKELRSKDLAVSRRAADALAEAGPAGVPALLDAMNDAEESVRNNATSAVRRMGSRALPALVDALKKETIRAHAVKLLGMLGEEVVPDLVKAL